MSRVVMDNRVIYIHAIQAIYIAPSIEWQINCLLGPLKSGHLFMTKLINNKKELLRLCSQVGHHLTQCIKLRHCQSQTHALHNPDPQTLMTGYLTHCPVAALKIVCPTNNSVNINQYIYTYTSISVSFAREKGSHLAL